MPTDQEILDIFVDTVIGELGTVIKKVDLECYNCKNKIVTNIPVETKVYDLNEYVKQLLRKQTEEIKRLKSELYKVNQRRNETAPMNEKIKSIIIEALVFRGMTESEAIVFISMLPR